MIVFLGRTEEKSRRVDAGDPDANYYVIKNYAEGTLEIGLALGLGPDESRQHRLQVRSPRLKFGALLSCSVVMGM